MAKIDTTPMNIAMPKTDICTHVTADLTCFGEHRYKVAEKK